MAGPTFWPIEQTAEVMRFYREFLPTAPRAVNGFFAAMTVPPVDLFPSDLHMRKVCAVMHSLDDAPLSDQWRRPRPRLRGHRLQLPRRAVAEVIFGVDPDPANAGAIRDWCVGYWDATHPHSAGGAYVNFMMDEGQERVRATYRDNYDRLARVKAQYDPDNVLHVNQNIHPAGAIGTIPTQ